MRFYYEDALRITKDLAATMMFRDCPISVPTAVHDAPGGRWRRE
jgi:hypothetical protein